MATRTKARTGVGGIPIPTDDMDWADSSVPVNRPKTQAEILWSEYSIQPNLPVRTKIEQLMLQWRLPAAAIAKLLELSVDTVQEEIRALTAEWADLGKPLDEESRQVVRGRMISELMRLKSELETASAGNPDSRLMTLKMQVIEKLTKLQGLDFDRHETLFEDTMTPIQTALDTLSEDRRAALLDRLKNTAPTS